LDVTDKVEVARDLINKKIPKENFDLLKYLLGFLALVSQNSDKNKMNSKNLSIVFGPNMLWAPASNLNEFSLIQVEMINNFVDLLIRFQSDIFGDGV
jgi:Rho GTPase-activating protein 1